MSEGTRSKKGELFIPKILLVGAGRFGKHHLRILKEFHDEGRIELVGAVIRNPEKRLLIESEYGVRTFAALSPKLLSAVDAVDIVTPPETHYAITKKCLEYTNVLVEKPLAMRHDHAKELEALAQLKGRILMVGHIFRFHPLSHALKALLERSGMPQKIRGEFINPTSSDQQRDPAFELLHLFDIIDYLWNIGPDSVFSHHAERMSTVDFHYGNGSLAHFDLGWKGDEKKRTLIFKYPRRTLVADFEKGEIDIITKEGQKKHVYQVAEPLTRELESFVAAIRGHSKNEVDPAVGTRIVSIAERASGRIKKKPRVAVIGGGIFGCSIASELADFCDVTLYERNAELMGEGSYINQFRHHYGYHYPRSDETVVEVQNSRADFENVFKQAIVQDYPTYYGLAKEGSLVSTAEFLDFCKKHNLPYKRKFPKKDLLDRESIELSVEVPEPSYRHSTLKSIAEDRLDSHKNVTVRRSSTVTNCDFHPDGTKRLTIADTSGGLTHADFDFVINATYANINRFADWLKFDTCPIRVDLAEVLIVKLPIDPISITVIDGPFATLMPTGNPNEFTLYHVKESIVDRYVPTSGLLKKRPSARSNRDAILRESIKIFPVLKDAEVVERRIVHRGVQANREHDDARVADILNHGFGCWSVLSGKILSSVSVGKKIALMVRRMY
jgi:predicted dehydrogenase